MSKLEGEGLCKQFGSREVVRDVSLSVSQGEVVGLLGPNGAGKTTTFYMLVGLVKPNKGKVSLDSQDISGFPLHKRAISGISYLPQESSVFRKLTVRQNMMLVLEHCGLSKKEANKRCDDLLHELGIHRLEHQKTLHLSGGERRRLEIARALIRNPKFILLDEPFAGVDPLAVEDIQNIVKGLREKGIGILISDHNVRETLSICDRAYLVYEGQIILKGTPGEIVNNPTAKKLYLGECFNL